MKGCLKNIIVLLMLLGLILKLNANSDSVKTKRPFELYLSKGFGYYFVVGERYIEPPDILMGSTITTTAHFVENCSYGNFFLSFKKNYFQKLNLHFGIGYTNRRSRLLANEKTREVIIDKFGFDIGSVPFYRDANSYNIELLFLTGYKLNKGFNIIGGVKLGLPSGYDSHNNSNTKSLNFQSFFLSPKISDYSLYNKRKRFYYLIPNLMLEKELNIKNLRFTTQLFYEYESSIGLSICYYIFK